MSTTSDIRTTVISLVVVIAAIAVLGTFIQAGMTHMHSIAGVTTTPTGPRI